MSYFDKFLDIFSVKKFGKFCIFSRIFSISFKFLLILIHIFEKLPQILGPCPIVKFRSDSRKADSEKFNGLSHNQKILHALLQLQAQTSTRFGGTNVYVHIVLFFSAF